MITFALSKGRILDDTRPLLRTAGIDVLEDPESSRKLILLTQRADVRVVLVRASDVPTYVQQGGADIGISGKDILMEADLTGLYEPLDLNIAKCRLMVAVPDSTDYEALVQRGRRLRVATKYLVQTRAYFARHGIADYRITPSANTLSPLASRVAPVVVMSTISSAEPAAGAPSVAPFDSVIR